MFKKIVIFLFVFILLAISILILSCASGLIYCTEDRTFDPQRLELIKRIESLIAKSPACKPLHKCEFFAGPIAGGINVTLYDVIDASLTEEIIAECTRTFFALNGKANVRVRIYKLPETLSQYEIEEMRKSGSPFSKYGKPYITFNLEGMQ